MFTAKVCSVTSWCTKPLAEYQGLFRWQAVGWREVGRVPSRMVEREARQFIRSAANRLKLQLYKTHTGSGMKKIYSKDECAPDAQSALSWLCNSDIALGFKDCDPRIKLSANNYIQEFHVSQGKVYMIHYT